MATIPHYSPVPFAPAATRGIFEATDAAPQQPLFEHPRAAMPAEDVARLDVLRRAAMLHTARPGDPYSALDSRARSVGLSVHDMVGATVAQAVAAMRAPAPAAIFSSDDEASPAARANAPSGMPAPSNNRAAGVIV